MDASGFAAQAHAGQKRFKGDPFIVHPRRVRDMVLDWYSDNGREAPRHVLDAAVLHDVVEDSSVTFLELDDRFGRPCAELVKFLTKPNEGTREEKREVMLRLLKNAPWEAVVIKCADRTDNLRDWPASTPGLAEYLTEAEQILQVATDRFRMEGGDVFLSAVHTLAHTIIETRRRLREVPA